MLREVRLKPAAAVLYHDLTPGQWYTAGAIAGLVKGARIVHDGPGALFTTRILDPAHFEFRAGSPRRGRWSGMHTRRLDRHPVARRSPDQSAQGSLTTA